MKIEVSQSLVYHDRNDQEATQPTVSSQWTVEAKSLQKVALALWQEHREKKWENPSITDFGGWYAVRSYDEKTKTIICHDITKGK